MYHNSILSANYANYGIVRPNYAIVSIVSAKYAIVIHKAILIQ